jgi:hypothetical protein
MWFSWFLDLGLIFEEDQSWLFFTVRVKSKRRGRMQLVRLDCKMKVNASAQNYLSTFIRLITL